KGGGAKREQTFLALAQNMRTHPADLVERNFPIFQRRISNEFLPASVVDGLNFGHNKRGSFRQVCHQVLQLSDARQVIVVRAILRQLQRSEVINALDLQIELLLKLEDLRQRLRRFGDATLPFRDSRISPRNPLYVLIPLAYIREQMRQIPLVGLRNIGAGWCFFFFHKIWARISGSLPRLLCEFWGL